MIAKAMSTDNITEGTRPSRQRSKRVTSGVSRKENSSANASGTKISLATYSTATTMMISSPETRVAKRSGVWAVTGEAIRCGWKGQTCPFQSGRTRRLAVRGG